jgi:hypothetical protein
LAASGEAAFSASSSECEYHPKGSDREDEANEGVDWAVPESDDDEPDTE